MVLYLNAMDGYTITDAENKSYTLKEAKEIVLAGKLNDCNLSFQRLINYDFDLDEVKIFYDEN